MVGSAKTALFLAVGHFGIWTLATWYFEGRIQTFLRPTAVFERLLYTGIANIAIGVIGTAWVLHIVIPRLGTSRSDTGFRRGTPLASRVFLALALGLGMYVLLGAQTNNPVILINAFAQVLAVSIAEVLVCWALIGAVVKKILERWGWLGLFGAAIAASLLFGFYHFAHSPPFNSFESALFLFAIGLVTSTFFFLTRDTYATIIFHNFLGVIGVTRALEATKNLEAYTTVHIPLIAMALAAGMVLIAADIFIIRRHPSGL